MDRHAVDPYAQLPRVRPRLALGTLIRFDVTVSHSVRVAALRIGQAVRVRGRVSGGNGESRRGRGWHLALALVLLVAELALYALGDFLAARMRGAVLVLFAVTGVVVIALLARSVRK
jgi:hypothetical protein